MIEFYVNNEAVTFDGMENTPLLWVLRDDLKLTGTKFVCGIGSCGACTVHIDGRARKTCTTKVSSMAGMGEMGVPSLAPALTNFIYNASGVRIRKLPIKDQLL